MFIVESDFIHNGLRCVGIFADMGHRCGYVGVPVGHPLYAKGYSSYLKVTQNEIEGEPIGDRGVISLLSLAFSDSDFVNIEVYFDVHGGVTYSGGGKESNYPVESDLWWIGFDCGHAGDAADIESVETYFKDDKHVQRMLEKHLYSVYEGDVVRTKEYVQNQCKKLADQIVEYCEKYEENY